MSRSSGASAVRSCLAVCASAKQTGLIVASVSKVLLDARLLHPFQNRPGYHTPVVQFANIRSVKALLPRTAS